MRTPRNKVSVHFSFLKSTNTVILVGIIVALLLTGTVILVLNGQNKFEDLPLAILLIVNVLLVALPIVLFVLSVIYSTLFGSDLSKKNIIVNDLTRFEFLSKIDVLCLEKDNVIADGTLIIKKVIPLQNVATEQYIAQWLSNMLRATNDKGIIFDTLNKKYDFELSAGVTSVMHYNDEIKYSGASFKGGKTIVLGNPEFVPIKNKVGILKRCDEDIAKGCRVLVIAEGKQLISEDGYHGELDAIALIILKDHVRDGAFETFKWFKDNGVSIKVVTRDNPLVTSVNALETGIDGADKYISLEGIDNSELGKIISEYTIFGYATPEQKEALIAIIKKNHKVMMVGGNESDILAMKTSSFAVATLEADDNTKKAADVVLEDASLALLLETTKSSKAFINNYQKILSLSLAKTVLAFFVVLFFVVFNNNLKQCLFVFNHLLLWDLITNGVAAYFLTTDKNNKDSNNVFIQNTISMSVLQVAGVLSVFLLYALESNKLFSMGIYSIDNVAVICVLLISIFGIVSLYNICYPLNKPRRLAVVVCAVLNIVAIAAIMLIAFLSSNLESPCLAMSSPAYFIAGIIAILYSAIYLFITRVIGIFKGDNLKDEN